MSSGFGQGSINGLVGIVGSGNGIAVRMAEEVVTR